MSAVIETFRKVVKDDFHWTTMGEISNVIGGGTPRTSDPKNFEGGDIPWITPADLSGYTEKFIAGGNRHITRKGLESSSARMLPAGAVLFTSRAPIGYVAIAKNPIATNQGFKSFVLQEGILPEYVYWWLKGSKQAAESLASGTTFLELSGANAKKLPIPMVSLARQREIVAEIEKQFSRLDEAVANLQRVKANLKRYKASVLKDAVEGRLVPLEAELARREGRSFETGEQLLQRILEMRRNTWSGRGKYKEAVGADARNLPELPEGRVWATLGQLTSSVKDGPHFSPKYADEGVPFISGGNIRPEGIDFSSTKFITPELHAELSKRCKPEPGDLLYTKGGTTGIARVNTETREFNVWVHVAVLKLLESVHPFYLQHALNSPHCYRQSQKHTHGVGNQDLGLTRMVWITVPLPPYAEQLRIVDEVERRLSLVRGVEAEVDANLKRAQALRQSVLQRAFSGEITFRDSSESNIAQVEPLIAPHSFTTEPVSVVMAARIIAANCNEATFGRVKLQKMLYLATHHGQVHAANDEYARKQAGPLDMQMLGGVIKRLDDLRWFREAERAGKSPRDKAYSYSALTKADDHKRHLHVLTPAQQKLIDDLSLLMRTWSTEDCELFATVYAAWNDLILLKHEPTVEAITYEVRENWHESKKRFSTTQVSGMIDKIKRLGYEPTGFGRPTSGKAVDTQTGELF